MGIYDSLLGSSFLMGPNQAMSMSRQLGGLRAMQMMQRESRYADPRPMRSMGGRTQAFNPFGAVAPDQPDYSQFTFNQDAHNMAGKMLEPYGLHPLEPSQVNPFALFPNRGFFGRHPGITNALEGGIFGAASAQGADTWGEGISNIARSMIEGPQMRHQMLERQFAQPFEAAAAMEKLHGLGLENQLHEAQIQEARARAEKLGQDPWPKYGERFNTDDGSVYVVDQNTGMPKQVMPPGSVSKPDKAPTGVLGMYEPFKADYLRRNPKANEEQIQTAFAKSRRAGSAGRAGKSVMAVVNGKLQEIKPGDPWPSGATSPSVAEGTKATYTQSQWDKAHRDVFMGAGTKARFWLDKKLKSGESVDFSNEKQKQQWFQENYGDRPQPFPNLPQPFGGVQVLPSSVVNTPNDIPDNPYE